MEEKEIKNKICPLTGENYLGEYCALYERLERLERKIEDLRYRVRNLEQDIFEMRYLSR